MRQGSLWNERKNCKKAPKKGIFRHALSYERGAFVQEDECPNLMDTKSDRHEAGFHRGRCFYNKNFLNQNKTPAQILTIEKYLYNF